MARLERGLYKSCSETGAADMLKNLTGY